MPSTAASGYLMWRAGTNETTRPSSKRLPSGPFSPTIYSRFRRERSHFACGVLRGPLPWVRLRSRLLAFFFSTEPIAAFCCLSACVCVRVQTAQEQMAVLRRECGFDVAVGEERGVLLYGRWVCLCYPACRDAPSLSLLPSPFLSIVTARHSTNACF